MMNYNDGLRSDCDITVVITVSIRSLIGSSMLQAWLSVVATLVSGFLARPPACPACPPCPAFHCQAAPTNISLACPAPSRDSAGFAPSSTPTQCPAPVCPTCPAGVDLDLAALAAALWAAANLLHSVVVLLGVGCAGFAAGYLCRLVLVKRHAVPREIADIDGLEMFAVTPSTKKKG